MKKIALALLLLTTLSAVAQNKPYITKIYDFCPAPGQFVNELPEWYEGDTKADVLQRVAESLCGYEKGARTIIADGGISLGAYGGYVVFGFDHPVVNLPGEYDFQIFGNSFQADSSSTAGGSSEPGIVLVSRDVNGNGLPDDPWYELAGSEYGNTATQHNYHVTYYRPDENKTPTPQPPFITDDSYIKYTCNNPEQPSGYINHLSFHTQSYWPGWLDTDTLGFSGTRLPDNASDESGRGTYWVQRFYGWGYVDNRLDYDYGYGVNDKPLQNGMNLGFKIEWAVDAEGNRVNLPTVDFIKVYNAVQQSCGWLGETSTEVMGAIDIHPDAVVPDPSELKGDINNDRQIDVADMNILINIILGNDSAENYGSRALIIDDDTVVDVADLNELLNIMLGK